MKSIIVWSFYQILKSLSRFEVFVSILSLFSFWSFYLFFEVFICRWSLYQFLKSSSDFKIFIRFWSLSICEVYIGFLKCISVFLTLYLFLKSFSELSRSLSPCLRPFFLWGHNPFLKYISIVKPFKMKRKSPYIQESYVFSNWSAVAVLCVLFPRKKSKWKKKAW